MAVLQAVTIVMGFDEAIVKGEEESRRTSVSDNYHSTKGAWAKVGSWK